jgi:hypothetical protein
MARPLRDLHDRPYGRYLQRAIEANVGGEPLDALRDYVDRCDQLITTMVASALESGVGHAQAVDLAIATFREIDSLARDQATGELLPEHELGRVFGFACSILASGTTFAPFEIAQRAVLAAEACRQRLTRLFDEWDPVGIEERLRKLQKKADHDHDRYRYNTATQKNETRPPDGWPDKWK